MTKISWLQISNRHNWRSSRPVQIGLQSRYDPIEFRSKLLEDFPIWIVEQEYDATPPLTYSTAEFWRHYEYRHFVCTPYRWSGGSLSGPHAYIEEFVHDGFFQDTAEYCQVGLSVIPIYRPPQPPGGPSVRKDWLQRLRAPVRNQNRFYYDTEDRAEEHWVRITCKPRYMYPPDYDFDFRVWKIDGGQVPGRLIEFSNDYANQKFWDDWAIDSENQQPIFYD